MRAPGKLTEEEFMAQVINLATLFNWKVYHTRDSRRSVKGFPDLLLLRGGVQIVAELKVLPNKTTPAQDEWLNAFRRASVAAFVWYPDDWKEIERVLGAETC